MSKLTPPQRTVLALLDASPPKRLKSIIFWWALKGITANTVTALKRRNYLTREGDAARGQDVYYTITAQGQEALRG
jgi:DNA-binding MarR family transcriptional regulator